VTKSRGGQVGKEFESFLGKLDAGPPAMATSASQLADLGKNTGVQIEYSKWMILGQLIWLAAEIVHFVVWAPEVIPALMTSARPVVRMVFGTVGKSRAASS
jgi:hypothetical protein